MSEEALKIAKRIERLRREFSMLAPLESRHNPLEIEEYQHYLLELEELLIVFRYLMNQEADAREEAKEQNSTTASVQVEKGMVTEISQEEPEQIAEEEEVIDVAPEEVETEREVQEEAPIREPVSEENEVEIEEPTMHSEMVQTGDSLNDTIKDEDDSLASHLAKQPIRDLKQAFGLNERFFYANELFGGDGQEFVRAINELNHLSNFEDAKRMMQARYQESYNWNFDDENVATFLEIVERRYL